MGPFCGAGQSAIQQYQDHIQKQDKVNEVLIKLSRQYEIPLAATNDVHYIQRDDWRAHEILLNIQSGEPCEIWEKDSYGNLKFRIPNPKRQTYPSHEYYFKSSQQMEDLFIDLPEAIQQTKKIAEKFIQKPTFHSVLHTASHCT